MNHPKKVIVMGSSNTDMVIQSKHLPSPGETILGGRFEMVSGGKGANQAVAASRLGAEVMFIGKVGDDLFGQQAITGLNTDGINTVYTSTKELCTSGIALIMVDEVGENCISVASGANNELTTADIDAANDCFQSGNILLTQMEVPKAIVEHTIFKAKKAGMTTIHNPAPAASLFHTVWSKVDILTPNQSEAQHLTGIKVTDADSAKQAATALRENGVGTVIITMGKHGSYVHNEHLDELVPAEAVIANDTTAAGDTFNGALACSLSNGADLMEAIHFATKAAAISVTRFGAQPSCPTLADVLNF